MTNLFTALNDLPDSETNNGAPTHSTTKLASLDFFFKAPTAPLEVAVDLFKKAYKEDPLIATKLAFWVRSPRKGPGMRDIGRQCLAHVAYNRNFLNSDLFILEMIKHGRYDDLISLWTTNLKLQAIEKWVEDASVNPLAAKWLPREKSTNKYYARAIAKLMNLSPKEYRKFLARNTSVTETQMCSKDWSNINFQHVPSQCMLKSRKAFQRNAPKEFDTFLSDVEEGNATINTQTIWPHQILKKCIMHNYGLHTQKHRWDPLEENVKKIKQLSRDNQALWDNLPNFLDETPTLVVADSSGSMIGQPLEVAFSLALYTSERLKGPWKDKMVTFSSKPSFVQFEEDQTIAEKIASIPPIIENTDLKKVFKLILHAATRSKLGQQDMPKNILVISDMEFDRATYGYETNFEAIDKMFEIAGMKRPNLIFWNVSTKNKENHPVKFDQNGTALISGYSPNILKAFNSDMTPQTVMEKALEPFVSC
jgi:hypothetical protein